jgi:hypothetical protein
LAGSPTASSSATFTGSPAIAPSPGGRRRTVVAPDCGQKKTARPNDWKIAHVPTSVPNRRRLYVFGRDDSRRTKAPGQGAASILALAGANCLPMECTPRWPHRV